MASFRLFFFLIFFVENCIAQQTPLTSQYMFQQPLLNPAAVGSDNQTRFYISHRSQWLGYQPSVDKGGSQNTQVIVAEIPLSFIRSAVGIHVINDQLGPNINRQVALSYNFRLPLAGGILAFGGRAGLLSKGIDFGQLKVRDSGDPLVASGQISITSPDFGAGIYYSNPVLNAGVALHHITEPIFNTGGNNAINQQKRLYVASAGYNLGISYTMDIKPTLLVRSDLQNTSVEAGIQAIYDNKFWLGAGYRIDESITGLLGTTLLGNKLRLGYAFDFVTNASAAKSATSHEILMVYSLPAARLGKKSIIRTPRYRYN